MPTKILVVDDHTRLRQLSIEYLQTQLPSVEFLQAPDALTGIKLALTANPSLVIMDIFMPGMDGLEAMRQIKQAVPSLPIIILTFHDEMVHRLVAQEAGAHAFVSKDDWSTELIAAIERVLQAQVPIA